MTPATCARSRPLRVVRVHVRMAVGGIEKRIVDIVPRLDPDRFRTELVCIKRGGPLADALAARGVPVHVLRCHGHVPRPGSVWRLARLFRRLAPDIVHAHTVEPSLYATLAARRAGVPVVITHVHNVGAIRRRAQIRRERKQSRWRAATIHVSDAVRRDYLETVRPLVDRGVVIYNGVDLDRFHPFIRAERIAEAAARLDLLERGPILLSVGRLHEQKGHADMLAAFSDVVRRFPDAVLLLAGDGPARPAIEDDVARRGLGSAVRLLGERDDVATLYHLADLHLLASHKEGFSNVVLEAMACGRPQVLTDVGGNREAVGSDGEAARLVPPRQPDALARALLDLLEADEARAAMGRRAAERARRFSVARQVLETEQLYLDCVRGAPLVRPDTP